MTNNTSNRSLLIQSCSILTSLLKKAARVFFSRLKGRTGLKTLKESQFSSILGWRRRCRRRRRRHRLIRWRGWFDSDSNNTDGYSNSSSNSNSNSGIIKLSVNSNNVTSRSSKLFNSILKFCKTSELTTTKFNLAQFYPGTLLVKMFPPQLCWCTMQDVVLWAGITLTHRCIDTIIFNSTPK